MIDPGLAGTDRPMSFSPETFETTFVVNTRATAHLITEFARRHVAAGRRWGRIITLSTDGAHCFPSEISYGASKLASEAYVRSAAAELGQFGITANTIAPGQSGPAGSRRQLPKKRARQRRWAASGSQTTRLMWPLSWLRSRRAGSQVSYFTWAAATSCSDRRHEHEA
jgi:NAD(P)-dependent dehydrogenase (short-subunit alcohol dehydrogenase family)